MKKIMTLVIVFVLLFSIITINNIKNVSAAGAIENNILTDYAYEIRLVKYEKSGDTPTDVGEPVLVYHPDLFRNVENHIIVSGSLPTTGAEIHEGLAHLSYMPCSGSGCLAGSPDDWMECVILVRLLLKVMTILLQ